MTRRCSKKLALTTSTMIFSCVSFACLCIAVSTGYWLYAIERISTDNQSNNVTIKRTTTGLWRKCVEYDHNVFPKSCGYVNYFAQIEKDGLGPTEAILLSMRRSTLFPLVSLLILLIAQIICFMSHCDDKRKVLTFVSGILFVIAGLCTLIGIILFIGAITEEAGGKSKPSMDEPVFEYWYGVSFMFTITSFAAAELTGVLSVYLYISRHKHDYRKKVERHGVSRSSYDQLEVSAIVSTAEPPQGELPPSSSSSQTRLPCNGRIPHNNSYYSFVSGASGPAPGGNGPKGPNGPNGPSYPGYRVNGRSGSRETLNDGSVTGSSGMNAGNWSESSYRSEYARQLATSTSRLNEPPNSVETYRRTTPV